MPDPRIARLNDARFTNLMRLIDGMRDRGRSHKLEYPNVDPNDGGQNARALFLLETPGRKSVASGFVSRCNDDDTAKNMGRAWDKAKLLRADVLLWNVVPYYLSTKDKNRNATSAQIHAAIPDTQAFVDALPNLKAIVFCGRKAQRAIKCLRVPATVTKFETFHTGAQAYNHQRRQKDIHETFRKVGQLLYADVCPTPRDKT
jgi:uracil-DNA glycosylase